MGVDIQIEEQILAQVIAGAVQSRLVSTCIAPFLSYYVDHINVSATTPPTITYGDNLALIHVTIDVLVVPRDALDSNVNGTPPEALKPLGQIRIILQLTSDGTSLLFSFYDSDPDPEFGIFAQPIRDALKQAVGDTTADLSPLFSQLGIDTPKTHGLQQMGNSLLLRFDPDPDTAAVDHLQPGQSWCIFLDAPTMLTLTAKKLAGLYDTMKTNGIGATQPYEGWAPKNNLPHVDVKIGIAIPVGMGYAITAAFVITVDFSFASEVLPRKDGSVTLQELVNWDLRDINANNLPIALPLPYDVFARQKLIAAFDPTTFGGMPVGPTEFMLQQPLTPLGLDSSVFAYKTITADENGMLVGGAVNGIPGPLTSILAITVEPFPETRFTKYVWCSSTGSDQSHDPTGYAATATVHLSDEGQICSTEVLTPESAKDQINPLLDSSSGAVILTLPPTISSLVNSLGQEVTLLLRTTRGVRIVNLGLPPAAQYDLLGNLTNGDIRIMNDCVGPINVDPWVLHFGTFNPAWGPDPVPIWVDNIDKVAAFQSSMITLAEVQAEDVVTLHQPLEGAVSVIAPPISGQVIVPAVFPVRSRDEGATLQKISRGALGSVAVTSRLFQRVAMLKKPGSTSHRLLGTALGAKIITTFKDRVETTSIDTLGMIHTHSESRKQAQDQCHKIQEDNSLPSHAANDHLHQKVVSTSTTTSTAGRLHNINLPGLVAVHSVPGFENSSTSVAELDDGTYRALLIDGTGNTRVTGSIPRWPRLPPVSGSWAISSTVGDRVSVFRVIELETKTEREGKSCCNKCAAAVGWAGVALRL